MVVEITPEKGGTTMKLKKLLALTLAGAVLTASLTACTPLDAAELVYDSIFGGGSSSTGTGSGSGNNGSIRSMTFPIWKNLLRRSMSTARKSARRTEKAGKIPYMICPRRNWRNLQQEC